MSEKDVTRESISGSNEHFHYAFESLAQICDSSINTLLHAIDGEFFCIPEHREELIETPLARISARNDRS